MPTILVPVRYPPNEQSFNTIEQGLDQISGDQSGSLIILHVRLLQGAKNVSRAELRTEIEQQLGKIPAHYVVRSEYLLERAIIDEAYRQNVDRVIIGTSYPLSLRRKVARRLGLEPDLEVELEHGLHTEFEVAS